jgi:putative ABC transport system substrate-binding protein
MPLAAEDPQGRDRDVVFRQALRDRGWVEGRNVTIDFRWTAGNPALVRKYAEELVALAPNVILSGGGPVVASLQQATRTIPIVFTLAIDPVGRGYVASLARPGGNITGFLNIEYNFSEKWLELLHQIAPEVTRAAVIRDAGAIGHGQYAAIKAKASSLTMEASPIDIRDERDLEQAISEFSAAPTGGLVVTASVAATLHRELIIALAARHRLPAVYPNRFHVISGGLISYGPTFLEQYRRAADYVDRILRGASPADLPVQAPVKYEMVLNLQTAQALGLTVPPTLVALADEVIE